ncbi:MAG TPA: AAA family ATPase [Tepidisphaeraceae bacterium]|nr:AAA family ATPase [Tepidisphaeraceae bacterium]
MIEGLRQAVRVSPENVPLRQHLADTLLGMGKPGDAEKEFRAALQLKSDDAKLKFGLARAFEQQGKASAAIVVLEEIAKRADCPPKARLLYARLLLAAGHDDDASRQYRKAVESDPSVADLHLADQLGLDSTPRKASDDQDEVVDGKIRAAWEEPGGVSGVEIERPKTKFADVGGLDEVKEQVRMKIIHPLKHPELYKAYGKPIGGGILMYGPPGCGKTFLARATAGEISAAFLSIGINDVLDMWIGNSEKNLHELFERARRGRPCVLFFDEVDALAASRADMRASAGRHLINQFLAELDGVQSSNDGVLILAATNAPWHVDPAFRRPGRFDRILFVPPPDAAARAAILRAMCAGKPVDNIDYAHVAKKTEAFSGADLKAVLDRAIEAKLSDAMKAGIPKPLTTKDLLSAAAGVRPSTREWFATARNYALYANQGGAYDDVLQYLKL